MLIQGPKSKIQGLQPLCSSLFLCLLLFLSIPAAAGPHSYNEQFSKQLVEAARERGLTTVGLLGKGGGELRTRVEIPIVVPLATSSDRIQEVHIKILHIVIETVERQLFPGNY